jgi:hypothetical protein
LYSWAAIQLQVNADYVFGQSAVIALRGRQIVYMLHFLPEYSGVITL